MINVKKRNSTGIFNTKIKRKKLEQNKNEKQYEIENNKQIYIYI